MDSWLALDTPHPDRRLVIEWIRRLQDLEREHEAASVPLAADWTPTAENVNKLPFPIREYTTRPENVVKTVRSSCV